MRVVVPECDASAFDAQAFARAVDLELRADGAHEVEVAPSEPAAPGSAPMATVRVEADPCTDRAGAVDVVIVDAVTQKTVERRVSIGDVAFSARARVLALAAAELLRASFQEIRMPWAPRGKLPVPPSVTLAATEWDRAAHPVEPRPAYAPREPPSSPDAVSEPRVHVDAAAVGRFFPAYGTAVVGPSVAVSVGVSRSIPIRARLDASALFGTSYDPLGSIAVALVGGGAALVAARRAGPLDVEVGPRLSVAWGEASGRASDTATTTAGSGSAAIVDLTAVVALHVSLGGAYAASVTSEIGGVLKGLDAEADGRRSAGFGGPVAGVAIGLGRSF